MIIHRLFPYLSLCCLLAACGSSGDDLPVVPPSEEPTEIPLRWTVTGVAGMSEGNAGTRGLIENAEGLETACTPTDKGGKGRSIGIWGDYYNPTQGTTQRNIFAGTKLIYDAEHGDNPHNDWNYNDGHDRYWVKGGVYLFRAYYPADVVEKLISSVSSAWAFVVECSTYTLQEDLLMAYKYVSTNKPLTDADGNTYKKDGKEVTSLSDYPVPLRFRHVLSALKFRFQFNHATEDYLTSCHLENAVEGSGLYTLGMLAYTCEGDSPTPESGQTLSPLERDKIEWYESYRPGVGEVMYLWENEGLLFQTSVNNSNLPDDDDSMVVGDNASTSLYQLRATAYTDHVVIDTGDEDNPSVIGATTAGELYTQNDGWLLVIPQKVEANTLELCFTTRKGGANNVYRVRMPEAEYLPGYRYTYTVTLSPAGLTIDLGIADWNRLDSSHNIDF